MRFPLFPFAIGLLLGVFLMLMNPLTRLLQTSRHILQTTSTTARSMSSSSSDRPSGLIAKSGIELLTWGTPNGHKAAISKIHPIHYISAPAPSQRQVSRSWHLSTRPPLLNKH